MSRIGEKIAFSNLGTFRNEGHIFAEFRAENGRVFLYGVFDHDDNYVEVIPGFSSEESASIPKEESIKLPPVIDGSDAAFIASCYAEMTVNKDVINAAKFLCEKGLDGARLQSRYSNGNSAWVCEDSSVYFMIPEGKGFRTINSNKEGLLFR